MTKEQDTSAIKCIELEEGSEDYKQQQEDERIQLADTDETDDQHQTRVEKQIEVTDTMASDNGEEIQQYR